MVLNFQCPVTVVEALSALNVNTILGDRLDLSQPDKTERNKDGVVEHVVRTLKGREIRASIIVSSNSFIASSHLILSFPSFFAQDSNPTPTSCDP